MHVTSPINFGKSWEDDRARMNQHSDSSMHKFICREFVKLEIGWWLRWCEEIRSYGFGQLKPGAAMREQGVAHQG